MIVRAIRVFVKPGSEAAFEKASLANHKGSIAEPGVLRFDVLACEDRTGEYLLYEVYDSEAATEAHKLTAHYKKWREEVSRLMARDREGSAYRVLAPTDRKAW